RLRGELADARARTRRLRGDLERPGGELPALAPARLRERARDLRGDRDPARARAGCSRARIAACVRRGLTGDPRADALLHVRARRVARPDGRGVRVAPARARAG